MTRSTGGRRLGNAAVVAEVRLNAQALKQFLRVEILGAVHCLHGGTGAGDEVFAFPLGDGDEVERAGPAVCSSKRSLTKPGCLRSTAWVWKTLARNSSRAASGTMNLSTR